MCGALFLYFMPYNAPGLDHTLSPIFKLSFGSTPAHPSSHCSPPPPFCLPYFVQIVHPAHLHPLLHLTSFWARAYIECRIMFVSAPLPYILHYTGCIWFQLMHTIKHQALVIKCRLFTDENQSSVIYCIMIIINDPIMYRMAQPL